MKKLLFLVVFPFFKLFVYVIKIFSFKLAEIDCSRLGHTSQIVEGYLFHMKHLKHKNRIIYFFSSNVANKQINIMIKRVLNISKISFFYQILKKIAIYWNCEQKIFLNINYYSIQKSCQRDPNFNFEYDGPRLYFTEKEKNLALAQLKELGITESDRWICLHNRDSSYLEKTFPKIDFSYHDYRDFSVKNMEEVANFFAEKGIYVFRMGSIQNENLYTKNSKIFDYAHLEIRNPLLDIFLLSSSIFYLGSTSGLMNVSSGFKRKCYGINYVLPWFTRTHVPYLFIFKKIRNKKNNYFLTLNEILDSDFCEKIQSNEIQKFGHELVENSSEEILSIGMEAYNESIGKEVYDDESRELLAKFKSIYHKYQDKDQTDLFFLKISPSFLKSNKYLLE